MNSAEDGSEYAASVKEAEVLWTCFDLAAFDEYSMHLGKQKLLMRAL